MLCISRPIIRPRKNPAGMPVMNLVTFALSYDVISWAPPSIIVGANIANPRSQVKMIGILPLSILLRSFAGNIPIIALLTAIFGLTTAAKIKPTVMKKNKDASLEHTGISL